MNNFNDMNRAARLGEIRPFEIKENGRGGNNIPPRRFLSVPD